MRRILIAASVALVIGVGFLVLFVRFMDEREREGELRAICSQTYMPECEEIER